MNINVMDLQDAQDKTPMASPAPDGASQEVPTIRPGQSAVIPRKLRWPGVLKNERYELRLLWRQTLCEWAGRALGTTEPLQPALRPFDRLGTVSGACENGRQWREVGQGSGGRGVKKRNRTGISPPVRPRRQQKGICALGEGGFILFSLFCQVVRCRKQCKRSYGKGVRGLEWYQSERERSGLRALGRLQSFGGTY